MRAAHALAAQDSDEEATAPKQARRAFAGWKRASLLLAVSGVALAVAGMSVWAHQASGCVTITSIEGEPPVAWAGKRTGPLERKLQVVDAGAAQLIVASAGRAALEVAAKTQQLTDALSREAAPKVNRKKYRKRQRARCILTTLAAAEFIAKASANVKSSIDTCETNLGSSFGNLTGQLGIFVKKLIDLTEILCSINMELAIAGFMSAGGFLAEAAISCSIAVNSTSSLNDAEQFDAGCAGAVTQMASSLVITAAAFSITVPGCGIVADGLQEKVVKGLELVGANDTSSVGNFDLSRLERISKKVTQQKPSASLASAPPPILETASSVVNTAAAPPVAVGRRLFIGGGKGALRTQCVVDIMQALTQLALMGTNLDAAVNADCRNPSVGRVTSRALPKFVRKRLENGKKAACGSDIATIVAQLGLAVVFLSFTSFQCTDVLDMRAMCGAGVAGITSSLASLASTGAATYLTCKEGQRQKETEKLVETSVKKFLTKASKNIIADTCPDLSPACFLQFTQFFGNCPTATGPPGSISASCPMPPSPQVCPGIQSCVDEFEAFRTANMGATWFPTAPGDFLQLVQGVPKNINSCFQYLTCFTTTPRRRLQSDALRGLLLRKMMGPFQQHPGMLSAAGPKSSKPRQADALRQKLQLSEELWRSVGRNFTELDSEDAAKVMGQTLVRGKKLGDELLEEAAAKLHKLRETNDVCPGSEPLL
mmetsp:Transcript_70796/g.166124  ORF Transcript_70796/g.166124 Transcript_70796/m.166124 type:complete len:713 (-) Transcript_70796:316-2454(-)